jgi:hypothetical protein
MNMLYNPKTYRTFLVVSWQERNQDPDLPPVWRFSLEDTRTDQRRGFANLEALVDALKRELSEAADQ